MTQPIDPRVPGCGPLDGWDCSYDLGGGLMISKLALIVLLSVCGLICVVSFCCVQVRNMRRQRIHHEPEIIGADSESEISEDDTDERILNMAMIYGTIDDSPRSIRLGQSSKLSPIGSSIVISHPESETLCSKDHEPKPGGVCIHDWREPV